MYLVSQSPFYIRYIVPCVVLAILFWMEPGINLDLEFMSLFDFATILFYLVGVVAFYLHFRGTRQILDKVHDTGSALVVERHGREIHIPYSQVEFLKIGKGDNVYSAEIHLISSGEWGKVLKFVPAFEGRVVSKPIGRLYDIEKRIQEYKN